MIPLLRRADDILRRRPWIAQSAPAGSDRLWLGACVFLFGMLYGAVMGSFGGVGVDRLWQVAFSAIKVPLLLLVTFLIGLPKLLCPQHAFRAAPRLCGGTTALVAAQAGLAIVLASLAPFTLVWYASSGDYPAAILFNALMFTVASFSAQRLLREYYRPLIRRKILHRRMLGTWLAIYVFVGIQMGWVLRPFVGSPNAPVEFFRQESWGNAYEVVARLIYDALVH